MVKTLRESKAKLSELIDIANKGEDVLITVRGKVKARLTRASPTHMSHDMQEWVNELQALQRKYTQKNEYPSEKIIEDIREDRF
jgi:prevent-host-death family protein